MNKDREMETEANTENRHASQDGYDAPHLNPTGEQPDETGEQHQGVEGTKQERIFNQRDRNGNNS
jgi:hypothetical protein